MFRSTPPQTAVRDRRRPVGLARESKHAVRREVYVPVPWGRSRAELTKNVLAGLSQTKLGNLPGWEDLGFLLDANLVTVSTVTHVDSISKPLGYWLVTIRGNGEPYARVLLSESGWLLSAMRYPPSEESFEPRESSWAAKKMTEAGKAVKQCRMVHIDGDLTRWLGSPDYHPLAEATLADGSINYVAEDGSVFAADQNGSHVGVVNGGRSHFARIR